MDLYKFYSHNYPSLLFCSSHPETTRVSYTYVIIHHQQCKQGNGNQVCNPSSFTLKPISRRAAPVAQRVERVPLKAQSLPGSIHERGPLLHVFPSLSYTFLSILLCNKKDKKQKNNICYNDKINIVLTNP